MGVVVSNGHIVLGDVGHVQEQCVVFGYDFAEISFELLDAGADLAHLGDKLWGLLFRPAKTAAHFIATSAKRIGLGDDLAPTDVQFDDPIDAAGQATVGDGLLDPVGLVADRLNAQHFRCSVILLMVMRVLLKVMRVSIPHRSECGASQGRFTAEGTGGRESRKNCEESRELVDTVVSPFDPSTSFQVTALAYVGASPSP